MNTAGRVPGNYSKALDYSAEGREEQMSNLRSEPLKDSQPTRIRLSWNRAAGCVAWAIGVYFTLRFFAAAAPTAGLVAALIAAAIIQWLLTLVERPLWRRLAGRPGGRLAPLAAVVTLIDGLLNAAGIYPIAGRIAQTDLGKMIADGMQVAPTLSTRSAIIVALILGLIVAATPEALWSYDQ